MCGYNLSAATNNDFTVYGTRIELYGTKLELYGTKSSLYGAETELHGTETDKLSTSISFIPQLTPFFLKSEVMKPSRA